MIPGMEDRPTASGILERRRGHTIEKLAAASGELPAITRSELREGDWVVVETRNSRYTLCRLEDGSYSVAGGWFDRMGLSPLRLGVNGCTFGGRAIKCDVIAAPGLFLEFDNRVTTTRIQSARVVRAPEPLN
jgi:hypothetical protein